MLPKMEEKMKLNDKTVEELWEMLNKYRKMAPSCVLKRSISLIGDELKRRQRITSQPLA